MVFKKILAAHFVFYRLDGISLQSQILHQFFRNRGWEVYECCSDLPKGKLGLLLPQMSYQDKESRRLKSEIFSLKKTKNEEIILKIFFKRATEIKGEVGKYLEKEKIKIIHLHNLFSLPYNPAVSFAFYLLAKENPHWLFISQNHDFISEGRQEIFPTPLNRKFKQLIKEMVLPKLPNVVHTALSKKAAKELAEKGIKASIIPDCFDFQIKLAPFDNFRQKFGIKESDLLVGVMTRILPRKAIEFAVQLVAFLNQKRTILERAGKIGPARRNFNSQSKIFLLLAQTEGIKENPQYYQSLDKFAKEMKVEIINIGERISFDFSDSSKFPFYQVYPNLDVLCYPTTQEGFGNQLLEAIVLAKKLVPVIFEYSVFREEISLHIPNIVSLGWEYKPNPLYPNLKFLDWEVVKKAGEEVILNLIHPEIAEKKGEKNFTKARKEYDVRRVGERLVNLFKIVYNK